MFGLLRSFINPVILFSARQRSAVRLLFSFLLSALLWGFIKLNDAFQCEWEIPFTLSEVPLVYNSQHKTQGSLHIHIKGKGRQLWNDWLRWRKDTLRIPYRAAFQKGYFIPKNIVPSLSPFSYGVEVLGIGEDTVFFPPFQTKSYKKVPISPRLSPQIPPHIFLFQPPICVPDSVTLWGTKADLLSLQEWETDSLSIAITENTSLLSAHAKQTPTITAEPEKVNIRIQPEKCTELILTFNIEIRNIPEGKEVKTHPLALQQRCLVPLSQYEALQHKKWAWEVAFEQLENQTVLLPDFSFLPPTIRPIPPYAGPISYMIHSSHTP